MITEVVVEMLDGLLTPLDGGNSEAGKAVVKDIVVQMRAMVDDLSQHTEK